MTTDGKESLRRSRDCQVCGERVYKTILYAQRFTMPTRSGVHTGYDVVVCDRCGFGFADSAPSQEFFDTYYRSLAKKSEMLDAAAEFAESAETIKRNDASASYIAPHLKAGDRVLEIGCYTGYLLSKLSLTVPRLSMVGIEPSTFAGGLAKTRYGIDVHTGTVFDDLNVGVFDFVIATHVLEHVVEVRPFLSRLRGLMARGGKLYIEVPDATGYCLQSGTTQRNVEPFFEFNFEHINYFTETSLCNMLEAHGFDRDSMATCQSSLPVIASTWVVRPMKFAADSLAALSRYTEESRAANVNISAVARSMFARYGSFAVWGAGAHTQRLIAVGDLDPSAILFFIDANPEFCNATLANRPIFGPDALDKYPDIPILISSYRYESEIRNQLIAEGRTNELVTPYTSP